MVNYIFEWDARKELENILKHGFNFKEAKEVFENVSSVHVVDEKHSEEETRYFAVGKTYKGDVLTVRYTKKENVIRIFGAAVWRKWRKFYEKRKNTESL